MARKEGVAQAAGKFIAFLDSDDRYDEGWMDYIINLLRKKTELMNRRVLISGITQGERRAGAFVRSVLAGIPVHLQLVASRLVATMFNPCCTPSIALSRNLCYFKDGLRHCEDYYSTAFALFRADGILLPQVVACHLGRAANSRGGESAAKGKMFRGEMQVRHELLRMYDMPLFYKLFVPVGMAYQLLRVAVKRVFYL
jgi:glycosyltransferase involved in cell wall biosynthesis